ncbi:NUDIX hydrolase [Mangrovibacterium sp.]|uniref:NUDIX hydrolase n=1 Tax=Mangrovibacterium sp. TaxID=1961364 RepID=UPI00356A1807
MYKVFFNEYLIRFTPKFKNSLLGNIGDVVEIQSISKFFEMLKLLEKRKYAEQPILNCLIEKDFMPELIAQMNVIPAAGGITRNAAGKILFIRRFDRWDLPKGKIEANESVEEAALREVEEECGLSGIRLGRRITSTYHIYRSPFIAEPNNWVWKETTWFEMFYDGVEVPVPQIAEDITDIRWFDPQNMDVVYESTYGNLLELLNDYLA